MVKLPAQLADFEIVRRLGVGGMAEVFLAKKRGAEGTYKLLVVKRILPAHGASRRFRTMFVEEAQLATRLNHPNIVQVYEFSDHGDDGLLLSMEYVEGFDLGKLMNAAKQKGAKIPPLVAAFIVAEAAKGLHYAHERRDEGGTPLSIVHRDVSPQNILLSHEGVVKIADFGIASASLFRDEPGVLKGKFGYMAPEQARGYKADRRSDIYSLGVVLYELLTLRSPYGKLDDEALLDAVKNGTFEPPTRHDPDVPPELEVITQKAMALSPDARFQSARDMAGAIARVLLAKQELVDNASVEAMVVGLLGRDLSAPTIPPPGAQQETMAAVPLARSGPEPGGAHTAPALARPGPRAAREVRHVAVVTLRIEGLAELEAALGTQAAKRAGDSIRAILDEIAYKRGAVWSWGGIAGMSLRPGPRSSMPAVTPRVGEPRIAIGADVTAHDLRARETMPPPGGSAARGERTPRRSSAPPEAAPLSAPAFPGAARAIVGLLANPSRAAADAAWLAVDVHEALAGASADLPVTLRAAIGIVRGIAAGERDANGHLIHHALQEPANLLGDRLGARTPPGATWVAGGVYRLVRRDFRWADAPTLEIEEAALREAPRQMRVYALARPLTREERLDETALAPSDLVGRDAEKADLHAALHQAMSPAAPASQANQSARPPGELVARVIVGEMGIGKTALVAAFLAELPGDARVLEVECSPVKSELPLATVGDVLRALTGMGIDDSIEAATDALRSLLGLSTRGGQGPRLLARLAELVTGKQREHLEEDAANYRRDVVAGVRSLLGTLARSQPLVIAIDGVQWADRASLELLRDLLEREDKVPILVLLVTRPEERVAPFVEGLVRIELRGLSAEEQVRLVEARLGVREGVAAVCGELVPRVAGNPFFLLEMVDALLERGALEIVEKAQEARGTDTASGAAPEGEDEAPASPRGALELVRHERPGDRSETLPSTLEQIIGDRLRELPAAEKDVVDWLAVAGGPLPEADIRDLGRLPDDEAVTRLCARGLCDHKGAAIDFRHPLVRDVAYQALDPASLARMHRRLGEHLAATPLAMGLSAAIVARHFARGEAPSAAAEHYLTAAAAARAAHQAQLAQRYYQRALTLLPAGDARRMAAHEALEAIYRVLGRRRERKNHLVALRKLARESGQARWAALALVRTARLDLDEGHLARGLPIVQRAAEITRIARLPALEVEALTILSETLRDLGDVQGAIEACERALDVAHEGGLPTRDRAEVLRAKGVLLRYGGRVHEAVEAYAEAIAVFKAVGARRAEARARNSLAYAMFVLERFEDAIAVGLSSIAIDLAIGGRFQIAKTLSNIGQAYARLGDTRRGLSYLMRARDAHERYGDQDSRADTLLCAAEVLLEAGDADAAHTLAGDAGALIAVTGSTYDLAHERTVRALLARASGDTATVIVHTAEARRLAEAQGLASYHAYATAIEAAARVAAGELHSGVLLARTALGAVEAVGSEYGIEVRALCIETLRRGAPSSAREATARAVGHLLEVHRAIREPRFAAMFLRRPPVNGILAEAKASGVEVDSLQIRREIPGGNVEDQPTTSPTPSHPPPTSAKAAR